MLIKGMIKMVRIEDNDQYDEDYENNNDDDDNDGYGCINVHDDGVMMMM